MFERRQDRGHAPAQLAAMVVLVEIDLWLPPEADLEPVRWLIRAAAGLVFLWSLFDPGNTRAPAPAVGRRRAWLEATAATLVVGAGLAVWIGFAREPYDAPALSFLDSASTLSRWAGHRLVLATVQQLFLQLFFWRVLGRILGRDRPAILGAAALFGVFHLPSPALAGGTLLGAVVWIALYRRSRRLLPLIASHALLAALASAAAPERLFYEMQAGARAMDALPAYRLLAREETRALLRQLTSDEYVEHRGGVGPGYVDGLYRDVLARPPTAKETSGWTRQLKETGPAELAKRIVTSDEAQTVGGHFADRILDYRPMEPGIVIPSVSITFLDDEYFAAGFSVAEQSLRWTQEPTARLVYPLREVEPGRRYALRLEAGTLGRQRVEVVLNGRSIRWWTLQDMRPQVRIADVDAGLLEAGANLVELRLPDAGSTEDDPRLLGVALISVRIYPLSP